MKQEQIDDGLEDLMSAELGMSTGHKDAIKALLSTTKDSDDRSDIDFKTDLLPREINGMSVVQTTGKITGHQPIPIRPATEKEILDLFDNKIAGKKFEAQCNIEPKHKDFEQVLDEFVMNHKRLRVSKMRMGRRETTSIFSPVSPIIPQYPGMMQPERKQGWWSRLWTPKQEGY